MRLLLLNILSLCLLVGCNMLNLEKEEPEHDSFQPMFTAKINGEPFEGAGFEQSVNAIMTKQGPYDWLAIFGEEYNKEFYPYKENISFALSYRKDTSQYDVFAVDLTVSDIDTKSTGGRYYENNGDVIISRFDALPEDDGYITVQMDTLEDDRVVVHGTFQMTVARRYRTNQYSHREADTCISPMGSTGCCWRMSGSSWDCFFSKIWVSPFLWA